MKNIYKDVLLGVAVGDALGVPVEFQHRNTLKENPVTDMREYGTHNQPMGTWSDDTSLTLCLADTLNEYGYDLRKIARSFYDWLEDAKWTPTGWVFDAGIGSTTAISKYPKLTDYTLAGGTRPEDNGNGSLMRILPLIFLFHKNPKYQTLDSRKEVVKSVSCLTHCHEYSYVACQYYIEFALKILESKDISKIFEEMKSFFSYEENADVFETFKALAWSGLEDEIEYHIFSTGYVVHTLIASIWCLLTTDNYKDAVLKAVNLGDDTDTTGAVTGGLAALYYGYETIPEKWIETLARLEDITTLADNLNNKYGS